VTDWIAAIGGRTLQWLLSLGHAAYFFVDLLRFSPSALRRFSLVVAQIHAIGNRSLIIILASGLAVGFVLALQMYYALVKYGAAESLGLVVNLSLVRELGPVVTALLFAGRAGTSLTAEIGLMKAGEQLAAMELMAIDPRARVLAPRFIGGIVGDRHHRCLGGRGAADRHRPGQLLVNPANRRGHLARRGQRRRQERRVRRDLHLRRAVPGL
jgi:phospholipid/cholesterol/gamma-HCH transport system permease protein